MMHEYLPFKQFTTSAQAECVDGFQDPHYHDNILYMDQMSELSQQLKQPSYQLTLWQQ